MGENLLNFLVILLKNTFKDAEISMCSETGHLKPVAGSAKVNGR
jgi:hypothetical protein